MLAEKHHERCQRSVKQAREARAGLVQFDVMYHDRKCRHGTQFIESTEEDFHETNRRRMGTRTDEQGRSGCHIL